MDAELKSVLDSIRESAAAHGPRLDKMQLQLDAIDSSLAGRQHHGPGAETKSIAAELFESAEFRRLAESGGKGHMAIKIADFQQKTLSNAAVGGSTSGVLTIDRDPAIVPIQYRQLRIRDLLRSRPTTESMCDFVKVSSFTNNASPQVETVAKAQSNMSLVSVSMPVQTLAHWIPVSKQIFQDLAGLEETIRQHLLYGLRLIEESQLLAGDGVGTNLLGILPQATAFNTALLLVGWNRLDVIARAIQQAERSDYAVDIIVLHTDDFWNMALTKNANGNYLFGDPSASTVPRLWGRPIAVTNSITSGTFLVGSSQTALIRDRQEAVLEVSNSHASMFVENMLAILCEERLCLQVSRPAAWIKGSFTTSP